jgi:hypothetical protein
LQSYGFFLDNSSFFSTFALEIIKDDL